MSMDSQKIRTVRLYEHVAGSIRARIVSGELREGERLPTEQKLADSYGVSRNVVREGIRVLAKDGLVRVRQGSGTFVANTTSRALGDSLELALSVGGRGDDLQDLIEIREIIEPSVAALAASRATKADLVALRTEVAIMEENIENVTGFIESDHRFHIAIAAATQNRMVGLLLYPIVDLLDEQRKSVFELAHSAPIAQRSHRDILSAIEAGKPKQAADAMRAHLQQVAAVLTKIRGPDNKQAGAPGGD
jgi:DNA-binding FadR family transcriptional regulator